MPPKEKAQKSMGPMEKRALEKLVNADYEVLAREMTQYAAELTRARHREIEAEFANRGEDVAQFNAEWDALRHRWQDEFREFQSRVRDAGLTIRPNRDGYGNRELFSTTSAVFDIPGKSTALDNIKRDVDLQMARAKTALERKRVETNRAILIAGLAEEATALLTKMPDPRELVVQALQESQNPRLALTLGIAPPAVPEAAQDQDGEVIEGLVLHDAENMADRGQI
jgi:hypothetical protein